MNEVNPKMNSAPAYPLSVYFDGDCPICRREIDLVKRLNRRQRLKFIDFSTSAYRSGEHGLNQCDLGKVIHARWSDGRVITGVEVFREMWDAVGLGFLANVSRWPIVNGVLLKAYDWFARNRLRLTGRT